MKIVNITIEGYEKTAYKVSNLIIKITINGTFKIILLIQEQVAALHECV